jgi:hypothetical protein
MIIMCSRAVISANADASYMTLLLSIIKSIHLHGCPQLYSSCPKCSVFAAVTRVRVRAVSLKMFSRSHRHVATKSLNFIENQNSIDRTPRNEK